MNRSLPARSLPLLLALAFAAAATACASPELPHAEEQVEALLRERPRLADSLRRRPTVQDWVLQRFREQQPPLFWDGAPPVSGRLAEWDGRDLAKTILRVSKRASGIDQLAHLLFELHNVKRYEAFDAVHEAAVRGELDRDAYARQMLAIEFEVLLETRAFYNEHLDDLTARERRDARTLWRLLRGSETLEEHLEESRRRGGDLLEHFRELHDTLVLAERKERLEAARER